MNTTPPALPESTSAEELKALAVSLREVFAAADQPAAEKAVGGQGSAAATVGKITSISEAALAKELSRAAAELSGGALTGVEARLLAQAVALDALFHRLIQFNLEEPRSLETFEGYSRIALRAQAQSARAMEVLATMKQPPRVIFASQLNSAHQQVVNNAPPTVKRRHPRRHPSQSPQPSLPEPSPLQDYAPLDTGSAREAAPAHTNVASVDESNRPPH